MGFFSHLAAAPLAPQAPQFWVEALKQVPALAVVCVLMVYIVSKFLQHLSASDSRFAAREERLALALDRNSEAFGRAEALADEMRAMRADIQRHHEEDHAGRRETNHAVRNLAAVAGWEDALKSMQRSTEHRARGGPPGTIQVVTPPVEEKP